MVQRFKRCWFNVIRYDNQEDTWHRFDPDLYIGCSGHRQNIPINRRAKVAIHVNPYGPPSIPGIDESEQSINWVKKQKPDAVFGYGFDEDKIYWKFWEDRENIKWIPMPTAADRTIFSDLNISKEYDIVYLGGRWGYKAKTIDAFLLPLLKTFKSNKVCGWGDWPPGVCSARIPNDVVNEFLNSGRVGPCISELHTHKNGIDVPERVWKLALCGVPSVHDSVPTLHNVYKSAVVAKDPTDFSNLCGKLLSDSDFYNQVANDQTSEVLKNHTYHHRLSRLLHDLGFVEESSLLANS